MSTAARDQQANAASSLSLDRRTWLASAGAPLGGVHRDWPISTDPNVHLRAIARLFDGGVSAVLVHSGQPDQARIIDFYGRRVLPGLARQASGR